MALSLRRSSVKPAAPVLPSSSPDPVAQLAAAEAAFGQHIARLRQLVAEIDAAKQRRAHHVAAGDVDAALAEERAEHRLTIEREAVELAGSQLEAAVENARRAMVRVAQVDVLQRLGAAQADADAAAAEFLARLDRLQVVAVEAAHLGLLGSLAMPPLAGALNGWVLENWAHRHRGRKLAQPAEAA
jgi:hypothetical protein